MLTPRRRIFLVDDAGTTVEDYINAHVYGHVAAIEAEDVEDTHDSSCECNSCVFV